MKYGKYVLNLIVSTKKMYPSRDTRQIGLDLKKSFLSLNYQGLWWIDI